MMEIEFSVIEGGAEWDTASVLLPLLQEFEKQYHVHVNVTSATWDTAWAENVKYGIYGHGPDVSMIGSSWVGSLAAMQALRPFTPREVALLGGANSYFDSSWKTSLFADNPNPWAIPWHGDVRVLFYWKDKLKEAGVENFDDAFATDTALLQTLDTLSKNGCKYPLAITVHPGTQALHEVAHWIWTAGGRFVSEDGKRIAFNQPNALNGFRNYFHLLPYINPACLKTGPLQLFDAKTSPIHIAGLWIVPSNRAGVANGNLGIAKLPGIAYLGGTHLAIWQYTPKYQQAFELIRFLSTEPLVYNKEAQYYKLPTKREILQSPMTQNDPYNRVYVDAFQSGQSFPVLRLWGSIADKLIIQIGHIWADLFANPDQDLDTCLHKYLDPLADRLNMALGN